MNSRARESQSRQGTAIPPCGCHNTGASMNSVARNALFLLFSSRAALAQSPIASVPPAQVHRSTPVSASTQGPMNLTSATASKRIAKTAVVGVGVVARHSTVAPTSVAESLKTAARASQGVGGISASARSVSVEDAGHPSASRSPAMAPTPPSGSSNAGAAAALSAPARRGPKVIPEPSRVVAPSVPEAAAPTRTSPPTP